MKSPVFALFRSSALFSLLALLLGSCSGMFPIVYYYESSPAGYYRQEQPADEYSQYFSNKAAEYSQILSSDPINFEDQNATPLAPTNQNNSSLTISINAVPAWYGGSSWVRPWRTSSWIFYDPWDTWGWSNWGFYDPWGWNNWGYGGWNNWGWGYAGWNNWGWNNWGGPVVFWGANNYGYSSYRYPEAVRGRNNIDRSRYRTQNSYSNLYTRNNTSRTNNNISRSSSDYRTYTPLSNRFNESTRYNQSRSNVDQRQNTADSRASLRDIIRQYNSGNSTPTRGGYSIDQAPRNNSNAVPSTPSYRRETQIRSSAPTRVSTPVRSAPVRTAPTRSSGGPTRSSAPARGSQSSGRPINQ
jgi:hypothetical protein